MESLSHSRPPNKKPYNNVNKTTTSSSSSTIYDDVFGGPPRFGAPSTTLSPRMEDYAEIFGSFHAARASSIPVLDLPAVEESEVCFDVKSSRFDYTEVFGGVEEFGLSFDDLVCQSTCGYDGSSDDAWTPADSKSLSGESDRSFQNQCSPNRDPYQPVNGTTEFNISYHKTSARNDGEIANGDTHMSQINNVPGFSYVVDNTSHMTRVEAETPSFQVAEYDRLEMVNNGGMLSAKHLKKSMSHPAKSSAGSEKLSNDLKSQRESTKSGSHAHAPFVTISEISLKTKPSDLPPPSRPPPGLDVKKGISKSSINGEVLSEESPGKSSPPYFDVEVDANSSAAASVAAMNEAMEKAQARLKSAKEQMERRKDGVQCCTKSDSVDAAKYKEGKVSKASNRSSSSKGERPLGSCDAENSGIKYSIREGRQNSSEKIEAAQDLLQEGFYELVHRSGEERLGKKSSSSQVSDDIDGAGEWKEEIQFFELVKSDKPRGAFEQTYKANPVAPKSDGYEFGRKEKKDVVMKKSEQIEGTNIEDATIKDHGREKKEKKLKEVKGASEQAENNECLKATKEEHRKKDIENKAKAISLASDQQENKEKFRTDQQDVRSEKKLDIKKKAKAGRAASERAENKEELKTAQQYIRSEMKPTEPSDSDDLVEIQLHEKANEVELTVEHRRKEKKPIDSNQIMENEAQQECHGVDYNERGQKKASKLQENEKEVRKSPEHVIIYKRQMDSGNRKKSKSKILETEKAKQPKEACWPEIGVKRMNGALQPEENEKRDAVVFEKEEHEKKLTDTHEREEKEERRIRSSEQYNSRILHKAEDRELSEARSGENYVQLDVELEMSEKGIRNTDIQNECSGQSTVHEHADGDRDKISDHMEMETLSAPAKVNILGNKQENQTNQLSHENDEVKEQLKETIEAFTCEVLVEETAEVKDGKVLEPAISVITEDGRNMSRRAESASEFGCQRRVNEATDMQAENEKKACDSGPGSGETWVDKSKSVSELDSRSEIHGKKPENNGIDREKVNVNVQVEFGKIEKKTKFTSAQVSRQPVGNGKKIEVDPPVSSFGMGNNQHTSQQACSCPSHGRREKCLNEAVESGDEKTEKMKRERELEEERLRKIEEEREREREREKDRMALDKETLEIREKASGERVAAEARQRALAEARERLERACAEAKEKTLAEKALDARLRAERAAVERATAEARARAAEKAMAERAALGTKERIERSVSDKFFASSRSGGFGQSSSYSDSQDHQFRSASFSSNTRYQDTSAYNERSEGVEGETAQRCKARLERHRRTAERAAKALAEKNMRDLIVQREQAERSRLAETLDADVKRWSSGKQGNLRALLSTLQYILGPESGWQPIPLTEVITSAAVKKAYRKATLCIHPDKLQQRGASIQQKYICEKVFDLLKEAWTKFNSEER